jgi:hypothetical protein
VPPESLARRDEVPACVVLEHPAQGGHVGFVTGAPPGRIDWLARRLMRWFAAGS